jgi:hypothetical protein
MNDRQCKRSEKQPQGTPEHEFKQYQQAHRHGHAVINALLNEQFKAGIRDIAKFEKTIEEQLAKEPNQIGPPHNTPLTQSACRDGMRLAALEFYWEHRDAIQLRLLTGSFGDEIADLYHATSEMPNQSDDYWIGRFTQIKARFEAIGRLYPDLAQMLTEGILLRTADATHIQ